MNEAAARDVLLVRAIETTDPEFNVLSQDDRQYAGRAAAELARWGAAERREPADAGNYLAQRARLLLDKLGERNRALRNAAHTLAWRPWIGVVLPVAAFVTGLLFERLGDRGHVNVLAFPLLVLIAWNLAVYLTLAVAPLAGRSRNAGTGEAGFGPRSWLQRFALRAGPGKGTTIAAAFGRFVEDWLTLSAGLTRARIARTLHLAAALFAVGAICGLYVRGLVFDYRAGWESTFLDARAVHLLLSTVVGPAAKLLGQPFPTVEEIAALRFGPGTAGESAARWIHWYALTVAALVVVPRLALATYGAWRAQRLANAFPLDLSAPYFRRLLGGFATQAVRLRVLPFSYTLDERATESLRAIARQLFGDGTELVLRPPVAFGDEARAGADLGTGDARAAPASLNLAVFNMAATPEQEHHGAYLDALAATEVRPRAALVDDGPYRRRIGAQAGGEARLGERRDAWRAFAASRGWAIAFADLAAPDLAQVERDLGSVLGQAP